jgi:hypothetical protein
VRSGSAALLSVLVLGGCDGDCPPGRTPRYDQCVRLRLGPGGGAGGDAEPDANLGSGGAALGTGGSAGTGDGGTAGTTDASTPDAPSCGQDQVLFESACIPRELFVDSDEGSDDNSGFTRFEAFKSFRRAMTAARAGQVVNFDGSFGEATGDNFNQRIPAGVTLQTPEGTATATFTAPLPATALDQRSALIFSDRGSLFNITLKRFHTAVGASQGEQSLKQVTIEDTTGGIVVTGKAQMTCEGCIVSGNPENQLIRIEGFAKLTFTSGSVTVTAEDCADTSKRLPNAISVFGSGRLDTRGPGIYGNFFTGIHVQTTAEVNLEETYVYPGCLDYGIITDYPPPGPRASINVTNSTFYGSVSVAGRGIKARGARFFGRQGLTLHGFRNGMDDLGKENDAGNNIFTDPPEDPPFLYQKQLVGLDVRGLPYSADAGSSEIDIIQARGNHWMQNVQHADMLGSYEPGHVIRAEKGRNVAAEFSEVQVGQASGADQ